jgi:hypothetical protein
VLICLTVGFFILAWSRSSDRSNLLTVRGTLETGVEADCVILRSDDGTHYLLLGWSNHPPAGTRVTVTGYFDDGVVSYCMQGEAVIHVVSLSTSEPTTALTITYGTATASSASVITASKVQQSKTITGISITTSGYVYMVVENPKCYPQCAAPSFILTYLYVPTGTSCTGPLACYPPPRFYRLVNPDGNPFWTNAPNGTFAVKVTGILVTPSLWNCNSFYVPKICMSADIYVQNLTIPEFPNSVLVLIPLLALTAVKFSTRRKPTRQRDSSRNKSHISNQIFLTSAAG